MECHPIRLLTFLPDAVGANQFHLRSHLVVDTAFWGCYKKTLFHPQLYLYMGAFKSGSSGPSPSASFRIVSESFQNYVSRGGGRTCNYLLATVYNEVPTQNCIKSCGQGVMSNERFDHFRPREDPALQVGTGQVSSWRFLTMRSLLPIRSFTLVSCAPVNSLRAWIAVRGRLVYAPAVSISAPAA